MYVGKVSSSLTREDSKDLPWCEVRESIYLATTHKSNVSTTIHFDRRYEGKFCST